MKYQKEWYYWREGFIKKYKKAELVFVTNSEIDLPVK
jgi:hypothetical protein